MSDEIKEIYLSNLEWTKTHDNMGGVMGNVVFKDNMPYEEYNKLFKSGYFVLCDKDYITNLQEQLHQASLDIQELTERDIECPSWCDKLTNLQQENERLKEENKCIFSKVNVDELLISNAMNYAEAQDYKSRVEKALDKIQYIIDYGFDYDGLNNVEDLKGLIDMLVNYARESKDILRGKDNES